MILYNNCLDSTLDMQSILRHLKIKSTKPATEIQLSLRVKLKGKLQTKLSLWECELKISEANGNSASRNERRPYKGLLRSTIVETYLYVAYVGENVGLTGIMHTKP